MSDDIRWPTESVPRSEFNFDFIQKMLNRRGAYRVAGVLVDHLKSARGRMARYEQDGNKEWLVDAANELMIQFEMGDGEFKSASAHESPGLPTKDGGRVL